MYPRTVSLAQIGSWTHASKAIENKESENLDSRMLIGMLKTSHTALPIRVVVDQNEFSCIRPIRP